MIIGICGGSGSGKTTLLRLLEKHFKTLNPTAFSLDNYYKPIHLQNVDNNNEVNFDLPTALDTTLLFNDFNTLVSGLPVTVKEYHFNNPPDKQTFVTLQPSPIIIIEGLFLFHYEEIRSKLDFSIFVDVNHVAQLERRLLRDHTTRGYSKDAILYQWDNHVMPAFNQYLLPYKSSADFIFVNENDVQKEFSKLVAQIEHTNTFQELVKLH